MNTIKFSKINNLSTERHNLGILKIYEENIFNNNLKIYHPCNLNIFITNKCQNKCFFCINEKNSSNVICDKLYYKTLIEVLEELRDKNFEVTITGGEPTLNLERFVNTLILCNKYNFPCRTVSTTGLNLLKEYQQKPLCQHMIENNFIHNINISRMHWKEEKNKEILTGINITNRDIQKLAMFFKFNGAEMRISCNIIPNYIDNFEKMLSFVEYYRNKDVDTVMFRELVGNQHIPLKNILKLTPENGFIYLKTLNGFAYIVDIYQYKDMIVKHYISKPKVDTSIISSFMLNGGFFMDNFTGKNVSIKLVK